MKKTAQQLWDETRTDNNMLISLAEEIRDLSIIVSKRNLNKELYRARLIKEIIETYPLADQKFIKMELVLAKLSDNKGFIKSCNELQEQEANLEFLKNKLHILSR